MRTLLKEIASQSTGSDKFTNEIKVSLNYLSKGRICRDLSQLKVEHGFLYQGYRLYRSTFPSHENLGISLSRILVASIVEFFKQMWIIIIINKTIKLLLIVSFL